MAFLVDTNILVYRHDPRHPAKQMMAQGLLRRGIETGEVRLPHQALVEFVSATIRPLARNGASLLTFDEARREAEEMMSQMEILYPVEAVVRLAFRGAATYGLSWFDAHMWAYAEHFGLPVLYSEDFQHNRLYGTVRIVNPFVSV